MKKGIIIFLLVIVFFGIAVPAFAADWWPIVPCGLQTQPPGIDKNVYDYTQPCNQCLLIKLGMNLINLVQFWLVPAVGTLLFIVGGFLILVGGSGGNTKLVTNGRSIMKDTTIGIAIILASWLITTTILNTLSGQDSSKSSRPWFEISCSTGTLKGAVDATNQKQPNNGGGTGIGGSQNPPGGTGGTTGGVQCLQSGLNLCQGNAPQGCFNSSCSQYAAMAERQANGVATANILKTFMEVESSCNINPPGNGPSFGLMQLTPPIPRIYGTRCGIPKQEVNSIGKAWLINPDNAEKSICIAAQWINAVAKSQCGSDVRNLYAGYNGGQKGACAPSESCAGQTSCSGEPVKKWECLYEDKANTQCNGGTQILSGYNQTRRGATRAIQCASDPGF